MLYYSVDRKEADFFLLETPDGTFLQVPSSKVSPSVKEGDMVYLNENQIYVTDAQKTKARKDKLFQLQNTLFID